MKYYLNFFLLKTALFLFFSLSASLNYAQENSILPQITFAYYGNVANEQGARISSQFYLKNWKMDVEGKKKKAYTLFLQPNIGFFSRPLFHSNFQLASDLGIRRQGDKSKFYHSISFGIGYLARMEVVSFTTDFKGDVIAKERETWDYIMPTLSYEVGKNIIADIGWFVKLNYGFRLPLQESQEESGMPLLEVGMKLPLKSLKRDE